MSYRNIIFCFLRGKSIININLHSLANVIHKSYFKQGWLNIIASEHYDSILLRSFH